MFVVIYRVESGHSGIHTALLRRAPRRHLSHEIMSLQLGLQTLSPGALHYTVYCDWHLVTSWRL